jgi:hypothetical protein
MPDVHLVRCLKAADSLKQGPTVLRGGLFPSQGDFDSAMHELAFVLWNGVEEPWAAYIKAEGSEAGELLRLGQRWAPAAPRPTVARWLTPSERQIHALADQYRMSHPGVSRGAGVLQGVRANAGAIRAAYAGAGELKVFTCALSHKANLYLFLATVWPQLRTYNQPTIKRRSNDGPYDEDFGTGNWSNSLLPWRRKCGMPWSCWTRASMRRRRCWTG